MLLAAVLPATGLLAPTAPLAAARVSTATAACERVKTQYAAANHFPVSVVAFCDPIESADSPEGFYVLALHSNRKCDGICSTNMGWFAVKKRTGRVFEWDVVEMRLGGPLRPRY
ncbi:hypothetical protein G7077_02750 [Sphingomonas piscis]|uniref:Uncharacterized protein n=1 Tax=Sphingomonas piscis TaxID=2714943 RepID=A0A6G7YML7_9SPHN|nr:hypothetical protein [Sphingomonas piscis]QIK77989.1 hypothetical protein G7077_02750 [Sphingomonas piscis]